MMETEVDLRLQALSDMVACLRAEIDEIKRALVDNDLWDNADMIRNWKISKRTLAAWRANGMIDFVQAGGKVWYTRENRMSFLLRNQVKAVGNGYSACKN